MKQTEVQVLLATYNGARYLREQIDSVLSQQGVTVRVLAHDDGSTDGTDALLREYAERFPQQLEVLEDGIRCGSAKDNFKHLLAASSAGYVAFCDQDDVWLPQKLSLSVHAMHALESEFGPEVPLLVYTDARVVNQALQTLNESLWQSNNLRAAAAPTFAGLLTENVATGCTSLLNRPLARLMRSMPATAQMHDHWASLLACGLGAIQAVSQATVLYRQHEANVVGAAKPQAGLLSKLLRFVSKEGVHARAHQTELDRAQAASLLGLHGDALRPRDRATLKAFLDLPNQSALQRIRAMGQYGLWRPDPQRRLAQMFDLLR